VSVALPYRDTTFLSGTVCKRLFVKKLCNSYPKEFLADLDKSVHNHENLLVSLIRLLKRVEGCRQLLSLHQFPKMRSGVFTLTLKGNVNR
jgi:hypothetical protein